MKKSEVDVGEHFLAYSERYYKNVHGPLREVFQNVEKIMNKQLSGVVLDIGNGGVFFYNTDMLEKIIAVDLAYPKEMKNTNKITFYSCDARDLSILEIEKVDCVLMQFLLHHIVEKKKKDMDASLRKVLTEAQWALKPGGKLVIVEPVVFPIIEWLENVFYCFNSWLLKLFNKPMVKFYSKSSLMSFIKEEGYHSVESQKISLGKRWIPLAPALFPGKFMIPPWLYPTRFCCITATKKGTESQHN